MTGPFVSSSCRVLEKKAHLVQPYLFTEEHGNLRNEASNQRSNQRQKVSDRSGIGTHWEIVSPFKTTAIIYLSLKLHGS